MKFDSRVLRAAHTADAEFPGSEVFGLHKVGGDNDLSSSKLKVRLFRLAAMGLPRSLFTLFIKYAELALRQIFACLGERRLIIHAHDLPALPLAYLLMRLTGGALVYDSHELWSDAIHSRTWPRWMWNLILLTEKLLIKRCDAVITVSSGVAEAIKNRYGLHHIHVIRNVPHRWPEVARPQLRLRSTLGLSDRDVVILHLGMVSNSASLDLLVEAMALVDTHAKLVFLGYGPAFQTLQDRARALGLLNSRIYFLDAVRPDELPFYTCDADIGAMSFTPICESYRYALPNKLFEYIQGGLAVVCPDLPELRRVILEHGVGATFRVGSIPELARQLNKLATDSDSLALCRRNARKASAQLSWTSEQQVLLNIYRNLCERMAAASA